jgi:hypothetical protein
MQACQIGISRLPVATVTYYGPNDQRASKVAVGITKGDGEEVAELRRWFSQTGDVWFDLSSTVRSLSSLRRIWCERWREWSG